MLVLLQKGNNMDLLKKKAFTLAEMMVVLLVISLAMAAFLPVMTKRTKGESSSSSNNIWQYVGGSAPADIYSNEGNTLGAVIGTDQFGSGESAKLLLNTYGLGQPHILFKQTVSGVSTKTGMLTVDSLGNVGLGNASFDAATPTKSNQISIGKSAQTLDDWTISIGNSTQTYGTSSIAIGSSATAKTSASNWMYQSIAIGASSNADGTQCVAIGPSARASSTVSSDPALAIGESAVASDRNTVALGSQAHAVNSFSVAIGVDATTTGAHQIVLGTKNETVVIPGRLQIGTISKVSGGIDHQEVHLTQAASGNGVYYTLNVPAANSSYDIPMSSDRRLKNVKDANTAGLEQIKKLKTFNYTFKKDKKKTPRVGVMAQDLKKVFPNDVTKGDDGYFLIRQEDMFYAMINAIKQLDILIKEIVSQVQTLDDKIMALINVDEIDSKRIEELELKNNLLEQQNKVFEERLEKLEKRKR